MAERQLLRWKIMEIISVVSNVQTKELQGSNGPFEIRYQEADLIMPNRRARALEIRAPRDGEYPPGLYTVAAESFSTNQWDQLELRRYPVLIPLAEAVALAEEALKERPRALESG